MFGVTRMDLRKALAEILGIASFKRIDEVTKLLKNGGVVTADDLKYFDWNSLKELGNLSTKEINKIMGYVQKKFPEEYEEHRRKRTEESKLRYEIEMLNFEVDPEMKLQQEMEKRLEEQQEMEEQLRRSQERSGTSKGKASLWAENPKQYYWSDFMKSAAKCKSTGMKDDFHENNAKQKKKFKGPKGPSKYENIEEVISEIFAGFSNEARINQIKHILHEDVITRADELSCFDWKSMEDLGLTSSEAARIMDFVKENFPKHFKIHEIRRDEANRMQEELSKCKDEIINLSNLEILKTWEEHSNFQAEKYYSNDRCKDTNSNINTKIELSTEEAVAKILEGCNSSRLIFVTRMLMEEGAQNSKELKSFNRNSLEGLGILEKEEIDKFLKFIQES